MTDEPLHEVLVSGDGSTVWVNGLDGSCIGRFSKRFGIDVHHTGTRQVEVGAECIYCTHEPAGQKEWDVFRAKMFEAHGVDIDPQAVDFAEPAIAVSARKLRPR